MNLGRSAAGVLAGRTRQVVGLAFSGAASLHFSVGARATLGDALAAGDSAAAISAVASYAQTHPAYVLAFLAGLALLVRRP